MDTPSQFELGTFDAGSSRSSESGAASKTERTAVARRSVCIFRLGGESYALDVANVGEVITVETVTPVPLSPPAILGMCNLRGVALAIVDLATVLELPASKVARVGRETMSVLVLRFDSGLLIGAPIERVEAIQAYDEDRFRASKALAEHPAIAGILDLSREHKGLFVSLLDTAVLERALSALKFSSRRADSAA